SLDSDRRMKKIILTEKALEYQEQVKDGLMELEEDLVKGIPEEKLEIFLEVINRMINNLSD
ncbi:MAG: MarR family transcriptional regulator, partial [Clostridium sp.]